jgi:hypothetical protein
MFVVNEQHAMEFVHPPECRCYHRVLNTMQTTGRDKPSLLLHRQGFTTYTEPMPRGERVMYWLEAIFRFWSVHLATRQAQAEAGQKMSLCACLCGPGNKAEEEARVHVCVHLTEEAAAAPRHELMPMSAGHHHLVMQSV